MATAERILSAKGQPELPLRRDSRLREWCLGSLEGGPNSSFVSLMYRNCGDEASRRSHQRDLPGVTELVVSVDESGWAEPFDAIAARLDAAFRDMAAANPGGTVLVVTHALAIKSLIYHFDPTRMAETDFIANASVTTLICQDGVFRAGAINDTHYLQDTVK